jgi:precorrin-6Y C5,15-methyltransferase (decarboxylating)
VVKIVPWLAIVGIGEDGVEGLSLAARAAIAAAECIAGGARHLALAAALIPSAAEQLPWPSPMTEALPVIEGWRGRRAVVLASGDPFCFGVGSLLAKRLALGEWRSMPTASAFSLAANRLGWALQDVATISFCGRPLEAIRPLLQPGARILALSADDTTPPALARLLSRWGFGETIIRVLEQIGGSDEFSFSFKASRGVHDPISPLNLMALEVAGGPAIPLTAGLDEDWFETDGQITKREIRALTLAALAPRRGELLWDIGAGSGAVGIEWMLRHPANRTIAIEARADRAARISRNANALGVPALIVREGHAPEALDGFPVPDAVFIGGGARNFEITELCWSALKSGGRFVVNAVTLETERAVLDLHARWGGRLTRIGIERLEPLGPMQGFSPARTVLQYRAVKP